MDMENATAELTKLIDQVSATLSTFVYSSMRYCMRRESTREENAEPFSL